MLVIRLARHGRTKYPVYRVVAADQRRAATSKFVAILGNYNPHTKEIVLKKDEIEKYLNNGAQASDRVLRLLKAEGVNLPAWAKTHDRNKAPKAEAEAKDNEESVKDKGEVPAEAPAEEESAEPKVEPQTSNVKPEGVETAEATAEATEPKAEEQKVDVGTEKEAEEKKDQAKAQEKAADAAVTEAQKEETDSDKK
jgi:small subunit ribosomal protein S16